MTTRKDNRSNQEPQQQHLRMMPANANVRQLRFQRDVSGGQENTVLQREIEVLTDDSGDLPAKLHVGEVIVGADDTLVQTSVLYLSDMREIILTPYEHAMLAEHAPYNDDLRSIAGLEKYAEYVEDEQRVLDDLCERLDREGFVLYRQPE